MRDLRQAFVDDPSDSNCELMWQLLFGDFDRNPIIYSDLESEYMNKHKWTYTNNESDKKLKDGFVKKHMQQARRVVVRSFNNKVAPVHGRVLSLSRPKRLITEKKYKKRKKGVCEWYMIKPLVRMLLYNYKPLNICAI
jgi:hypothetical protein